MTWFRGKVIGFPLAHEESKIFPVEQHPPMYYTVTESPATTGVPVPVMRSSTTSDVGTSPTGMVTSGAPAGSVSLNATHGFPAAEGSVSAETVVEVASVVVVVAAVVDVELLSLSPMNRAAVATTTTAAPMIEKSRRRR
jgi:hypothetical protein